jgi:ribosomal protein S18 acetylase RimI-like enzyme
LAEEQDLPEVARYVVATFGADAIRVSQDFGQIERILMKPAIDVVNGYSALVAYAEVLSGLRQRTNGRLTNEALGLALPPLKGLSDTEIRKAAASTSIVLVLGKRRRESDWQLDVIGSVELQLQLCDGKIPFTLPWLDAVERHLWSLLHIAYKEVGRRNLEPYLSNLCVDESLRGRGIGRALVRCVESIAALQWKCSNLYLHVDAENKAAMQLYTSEGYADVGRRWTPFWAGAAAKIGYLSKRL